MTQRRFPPYAIGIAHVRSVITQISWLGAVFGFAAETDDRTAAAVGSLIREYRATLPRSRFCGGGDVIGLLTTVVISRCQVVILRQRMTTFVSRTRITKSTKYEGIYETRQEL